MNTNTTTNRQSDHKTKAKSRRKLYAALDLHGRNSVLGSMTLAGEFLGSGRFPTREGDLVRHVRALPSREIYLTMEAGPKARWAAKLLRPHCREVVVCEPRENRLISTSTRKGDTFDTRQLCRLYRLGELKVVWVGDDPARDVFRYAVYDMLKLRDRARESKVIIKSRLAGWGLPVPAGREVYGKAARGRWLEGLPCDDARAAIAPLYDLFDATKAAENAARREVKRQGKAFPETGFLQGVPGIAFAGAHVFVGIVEDPGRFSNQKELWRFSALGVTSRSSDGKPLGYERLDRRGHRELKNLSYHAWRTATRSTTRDNAVKRFYHESRARTGVTHARLATQRKVLTTMWTLWRKGAEYSDEAFLQSPDQRRGPPPAGTSRPR